LSRLHQFFLPGFIQRGHPGVSVEDAPRKLVSENVGMGLRTVSSVVHRNADLVLVGAEERPARRPRHTHAALGTGLFQPGPTAVRLSPHKFTDPNHDRSIKGMTSRQMAKMGILGSAVVALALLTMGSGPRPKFGDPLQGLARTDLARFQAGKTVFEREFTPRQGLGPVFNNTACAQCHDQGAIGGGSDTLETRYGQVINGVFNSLTQFDGQLLHSKGIGLFNGVDFVGEVVPPEANVVAQRRTTPLFGLGLVDAVPDQFLKDLAQFEQDFTPETAGRALVLTDVFSGQPRVGRFGWKCQIGTVATFTGNAFLNEMGITTPFFPHENPPGGDSALLAANPALTNPNDTTATVMQLADHTTFLAPPPRRPMSRSARVGEVVFLGIGCADCHLPAMRTGPNEVAALDEVDFFPFSDFLVHDMGSLNDGIAQAPATGQEMRTAPLWGARIRTSFLHDGRAKTIREAILAHDGQGLAARNRFAGLNEREKANLLAFINSL
jgi:CxxC motif-containing protein (DUF1111 family)